MVLLQLGSFFSLYRHTVVTNEGSLILSSCKSYSIQRYPLLPLAANHPVHTFRSLNRWPGVHERLFLAHEYKPIALLHKNKEEVFHLVKPQVGTGLQVVICRDRSFSSSYFRTGASNCTKISTRLALCCLWIALTFSSLIYQHRIGTLSMDRNVSSAVAIDTHFSNVTLFSTQILTESDCGSTSRLRSPVHHRVYKAYRQHACSLFYTCVKPSQHG